MSATADVVVVGAGMVGAACAYYLSEAGASVCLVERNFPASGTSRACDGLVLLWDKASATEQALGQASANLWAELSEQRGLACDYARRGSILLAEDDVALAAGRRKAAEMQAASIRAELLDGRALCELEPHLAGDLAGGVFFPDDAQVDPRRATAALLDAARGKGMALRCDAALKAVRRGPDGRVLGITAGTEEIVCGALVCAAGVWSNDVARLAGIELPIRPRKGHILVAARMPGLLSHPLLEGSYVSTVQSDAGDVQVALVAEMTRADTLLLGSSREFAGFDDKVSVEIVQAIAARALRFLPELAEASIIRSYTGWRPWSPDHLPLIGPAEKAPGFYVATGHEGAGIGLAPITGQLIAGWITGQPLPALAHELLPDRFN